MSFSSDRVLASILTQHQERPVETYVYNTESDTVRMVTLLPTYEWGSKADGLLGAKVGMGYLHTFPAACRATDGASMEMSVVRTLAQRPISYDGEDDGTEEGEIIDLTREENRKTAELVEKAEKENNTQELQLEGKNLEQSGLQVFQQLHPLPKIKFRVLQTSNCHQRILDFRRLPQQQ